PPRLNGYRRRGVGAGELGTVGDEQDATVTGGSEQVAEYGARVGVVEMGVRLVEELNTRVT
ncbi:MAG: hypothetical protein JWN00_5790, partial [Actinomycetia bacterium]|nr:hypothetical protein [Actinomycetes bacterium]